MPIDIHQDATSGWYLPETSAQWTALLDGLGMSAPNALWLFQETSGNFADSIGANTLTNAGLSYQRSVSGWTRKGIGPTADGSGASAAKVAGTVGDIDTASHLLLAFVAINTTSPAATRDVFGMGSGASFRGAQITSGKAYKATPNDGSATATGGCSAGETVRPVLVQINRTSGYWRVVSDNDAAQPTPWTAPPAAGAAIFFGAALTGSLDYSVLYAACWRGSSSEITETQIRSLLSRMQTGAPTTRAAFARGSNRQQWVVCIDGYDKLLTDGDTTKAIAAHAGSDWTQALGGLVTVCRPSQSGNPNDPFPGGGGSCLLYMKSYPDAARDTFGIETHRRGGGAWTTLGATIDRNDTALVLRNNTSFPAGPSEAHIGVECVEYSGTSMSAMTVTTRGKYTGVGCAPSGSGGNRFADHHRVALDQNQVQSNPVISTQPRRWIDRRVHCYLHTLDEAGNYNSKLNAELVYEGRIDALSQDPGTGCTVVKLRHVLEDLANATVGRSIWGGECTRGIYLATSMRFKFRDYADAQSGAAKNATDLLVVASGAVGTNQINAGYYEPEEIAAFLNRWLGAEKIAARIYGQYTWTSPMQTEAGVRTVVDFLIPNGTGTFVSWSLTLPAGVGGYLGLKDVANPALVGGSFTWDPTNFSHHSNAAFRISTQFTPWRSCVFGKGGGGGTLPTFNIQTENERGEFVDQYDLMPAIVKTGLDSSKQWGLFLVDERLLIQASYANGVLGDCYITPLGQNTLGDDQSFFAMGRRCDDDAGPITVRQVFDLEGSFEQLMNILHYNTGTPGYNHADYDISAAGIGIGLPGGILGEAFERSIANLPRAEATMRLRFDEPKTLKELIGDELMARRAFPVWKNGGIVYQKWHTPVVSLATFELTEENKARPAGSDENSKSPTLETNAYARPIAKFDYDPDFTFGREVRFRGSMQLTDGVAVDDGGGNSARPITIKLRNTANLADALALQAGYLATMPMTARPSKYLNRSIGPRHYFGVAPGDNCLVYDHCARDPLTGMVYDPATGLGGLNGRPATVMRHSFDLGGTEPGKANTKPRPSTGDIDVNFFDVNRGSAYGPSGDIDESVSGGGFSAGYNSAVPSIRLKDHAYSETTEPVDAASLGVNGYALLIVEKDPTNPAAPLMWSRTALGRSGSDLTLSSALAAPAWDATKTYRVLFDHYTLCTAVQRDAAFQADEVTELVESVEVPYHWCSTPEESDWTYNTDQLTEFMPDVAAADGKSLDVGHEVALITAINNLHDHKTAHHPIFMWSEQPGSYSPGQWLTRYFGRFYLGLDQGSNAVYRLLTIAPWLWLNNSLGATTGYVRVTISRDMPRDPNGIATSYQDPVWDSFYSQATFSTTSTTPAIAAAQDLAVNVKDLWWGMAFITVQAMDCYVRGLPKGRESARVLVL